MHAAGLLQCGAEAAAGKKKTPTPPKLPLAHYGIQYQKKLWLGQVGGMSAEQKAQRGMQYGKWHHMLQGLEISRTVTSP